MKEKYFLLSDGVVVAFTITSWTLVPSANCLWEKVILNSFYKMRVILY